MSNTSKKKYETLEFTKKKSFGVVAWPASARFLKYNYEDLFTRWRQAKYHSGWKKISSFSWRKTKRNGALSEISSENTKGTFFCGDVLPISPSTGLSEWIFCICLNIKLEWKINRKQKNPLLFAITHNLPSEFILFEFFFFIFVNFIINAATSCALFEIN